MSNGAVWIDYTNWRGERRWRHIRPRAIRFGSNQWHDEQWLLEAHDLESFDPRSFAMANIHAWSTEKIACPNTSTAGSSSSAPTGESSTAPSTVSSSPGALPELALSEEGIRWMVENASARKIPVYSDALVKTALAAHAWKAEAERQKERAKRLRDERDDWQRMADAAEAELAHLRQVIAQAKQDIDDGDIEDARDVLDADDSLPPGSATTKYEREIMQREIGELKAELARVREIARGERERCAKAFEIENIRWEAASEWGETTIATAIRTLPDPLAEEPPHD